MARFCNFFYTMLIILIGCLISLPIQAQDHKGMLRDTLDNRLDLSDYVINLHGFVPYPVIISEPALGNFGGALALVFISPKKNTKNTDQFYFPDITAVAGMYTLNNSWAAGAFRQGSFPSLGLRYQTAFGYADINMDFYRELPEIGEQKFQLNLSPIILVLDVGENIYKNKFFLGARYQFSKTKVSYDFSEQLDPYIETDEFNKNLGALGFYAEMDTRNTIFTPDKGIRFRTTYYFCRQFTGSDFNTDRLEMYTHFFFQPAKRWVSGFKAEWMMVKDGAPFYYYPYLIMRGIPAMRYQGEQTLLFETEQRFDLNLRWSLVGFVGTGKGFSDSKYLGDNKWHAAGGAGFRYLVARLFKLRMGIDIAAGPDQLAYYIVFGHYWNR